MASATELLTQWEALQTTRRPWVPVWQELGDYIQPRRSNVAIRRTPGQLGQADKLFESTALGALSLLAASMQGSLTSSSLRWFDLRIRGLDLGDDDDITRWLQACSDKMYDALRQSNFAAESHELYADLACYGTGALFVEARPARPGQLWTGVRFTALPPGTYAIDEDADGAVDLVFMEHTFSARAAVERFGARVSRQVAAAAERKEQQFELYPFLHCVFPRAGVEYSPLRGAAVPATRLPWASVWVDVTGRRVVRESGYHEFPFMAPRWAKASGETYGRGPGHDALPDIKTLNKTRELKLRALAKVVRPPTLVRHDGVLGQIDLSAGGQTYVYDMDAVQPLDPKIQLDKILIEEKELQVAIRQLFYADQLQLQQGPQMTATEVQVRFELMQRILGPTLGRLEVELLNPLVERVFWVMSRAGALPPMPLELAAWLEAGGVLDIEYEGALARAQRLADTVAHQRLLQFAVPIVQIDPEALDVLDTEELLRETAINVGAKAKVLRSRDDVEARRQARRDQEAQAQATANVATAAEAIGAAGPGMRALSEIKPELLAQAATGLGGVA